LSAAALSSPLVLAPTVVCEGGGGGLPGAVLVEERLTWEHASSALGRTSLLSCLLEPCCWVRLRVFPRLSWRMGLLLPLWRAFVGWPDRAFRNLGLPVVPWLRLRAAQSLSGFLSWG
jgi:hypothetical protein